MLKKYLIIITLIGSSIITLHGDCCSDTKKSPTTTKEVIQNAYGKVAQDGGICELFGGGCCGGGAELSQYLGYSDEELKALDGANLGLGCGNPVTYGDIKEGDVILDLGSGAGLDCLLAARQVGKTGKVIGVDMTLDMIKKARENAEIFKCSNVEFREGDIEALPVKSNSIDIIISNCVINLAPNKLKVFHEAYRVLKSDGKMYVSDVVLLKPLSVDQEKDEKLLCACVAGALLKKDYIAALTKTGFDIEVLGQDNEINKKWFGNDTLPIASLKFIARKK